MRDAWDFLARRAALITSFLFVGAAIVASAKLDGYAGFHTEMGYVSAGPQSWLLLLFPAIGALLYAIARACAERTRNAMQHFAPLALIAITASLMVVIGSAILYETRLSPSQGMATLVVSTGLVAIPGLFALAWSTVAALMHAENPGAPPRLIEVLPTFFLVVLVLPLSLWFIQDRVNAVLERPRLS